MVVLVARNFIRSTLLYWKKFEYIVKPFVGSTIIFKAITFFRKCNMQKYGLRIIFCYQYKLSRKDQISAKFNLHDLNKKKKKYVYRFQRFCSAQFWLKISIFSSPPVYGTIVYLENEILLYRDLIQSRMKYGNNVIIGTKRSRAAQLV